MRKLVRPCLIRPRADVVRRREPPFSRMPYRGVVVLVLLAALGQFIPAAAFAGAFTVFGPKDYLRSAGEPKTVTDSFIVQNPGGTYTISIYNGGLPERFARVSSAKISLNGMRIFGPSDFNPRTGLMQKTVNLSRTNLLQVTLQSNPASGLTIRIDSGDNEPPAIKATPDPPPNAAGWNNTSVTVRFDCADASSGIATCPSPVVVSREGANQIVRGTATDGAGNTATASVTVNIDETPPKVGAEPDPSPNAAGWNRTNVTVRFSATDALSGIASVSDPKPVTAEGAGQEIAGSAVDRAGNQASASVKVSLDRTPPAIRAAASPLSNANGWINSDATVVFDCTDGLSGVMTCPAPALVGTEGEKQVVGGTAVDKAGNTASAAAMVSLDKTPPLILAAAEPPPNAAGWNRTDVTVRFTATDVLSGIASVSGPAPVTSEGADHEIAGSAEDRAGNRASASVKVSLDKSPPSIHAVVSPAANANGWINQDATVSFECADEPGGIALCPPLILVTTEGEHQVVTGTAVDVAGNSAGVTATVSVDKTPPAITADLSPAPNPGGWNKDDVTVTFSATDSLSGTSSVTPPVPVTQEGASRVISGTATDRAGLSAGLDVTVNLDKTAPALSIASPSSGSVTAAGSISVTGTVADATSVSVTVNGVPAQLSGGGFIAADVPLAAGSNAVTASALDLAGNSAVVTVYVLRDTTAPSVRLLVAGEVVAGGQLHLGADASDPEGIASVSFYVNGNLVATDTDVPFETTFMLPSGLLPGAVLVVEVRAIDAAGLESDDSAMVRVIGTQSRYGVIAGLVLDDTTGLPIEGATVQVITLEGQPPAQPLEAHSDTRGRFRLASLVAGAARIRIDKAGFTSAERVADFVAGRRTDPEDARLTPLDPTETVVLSVIGGMIANAAGDATLILPPGALGDDQGIRLTRVGAQGLTASLPSGWSPVAAVEVSPGEIALRLTATLSVAAPEALAGGAGLTMARWDGLRHAWVAKGTVSHTAGQMQIATEISQTGQYAWLLPDAPPLNPPSSVIDTPIPGLLANPPPLDPATASAAILPSPKILFARPDAHSRVQVQVTPPAPAPSGTPFEIDLGEAYDFQGGGRLVLGPTATTLTLHAFPPAGGPLNLGAEFTATPSRSFEALALRQGVIGLAGRLPGDPRAPRGSVIGPEGGAASPDGGATSDATARLAVPAGAAAGPLPVLLSSLAASEFPLSVPPGLTFLGAVALDLHGGAFGAPVTLAIPAPVGLPSDAQVLLVQVVEVNNLSYLALVGTGAVQAGQLAGVVDPKGDGSVRLPGVRQEGGYAFLRAETPVGFVVGTAYDRNGHPLPGAIVSVDTMPLISLADADGRYVLVAPVGDFLVTGSDPATGDVLARSGTVADKGGVTSSDLLLSAAALSIVSVSPPDGARNVPLESLVTVIFSKPIDPGTVAPGALSLSLGGVPVAGSAGLAPGGRTLTFRPDALLASQTTCQVGVAATIKDLKGNALGAPFIAQFSTVDVTSPPRPPAGSISATIPDENGVSVVSGSQGSAEPGGVVFVRNPRTGTVTAFTPNADGSFSGTVIAARSDKLVLIIRDAAGNETTVPLGPFRNPDGSTVVGSEGGRVDGPGGVFVAAPPGALPDGTVVKIDPIAAGDLPLPEPAEFPFLAGARLALGGVKSVKPLTVGVAPPQGAASQDPILVAGVLALRRGPAWTLLDRAHLSDDRYVSAAVSPFPGITAEGIVAFLATAPLVSPVRGATIPRAEATPCVSFVQIVVDFADELIVQAIGSPFVFLTSVHSIVTAALCDKPLRITVTDPDTNAIIREIDVQSPAAPDQIFELPDGLTDDQTRPFVIETNTFNGQQVAQIEVRFSEAMDVDSVKMSFTIEDSHAQKAAGAVSLSIFDTLAVFTPAVPFHLGEQYLVNLEGSRDKAGNPLVPAVITFTPFDPGATDPFPISSFAGVPGLGDLLTKCANGACNTSVRDVAFIGNTLFLANGLANASERYRTTPAARLIALDSSHVTDPFIVGTTAQPSNPRVLAGISSAAFTDNLGHHFAGDLLLVASGGRVIDNNELPAKLEVYDATRCTRAPVPVNCLDDTLNLRRSEKLLSTPTGNFPRTGVPPESGVPQQIAVLHQTASGGDVVAAYVVVSGVGIEAVDVTRSFNDIHDPNARLGPDGLVRGDFLDVAVLKNKIASIELDPGTGEFSLALFSAQLTDKETVPLFPDPAARLAVLENFLVDVDRDGRVGTAEDNDQDEGTPITALDELFDLAIVGSGPLTEDCGDTTPCGMVEAVDLSQRTDLAHASDAGVIARIPLPGPVFSIQVDRQAELAYAEVRGKGLAIIDLGSLRPAIQTGIPADGLQDANQDGLDDRVLAIIPKTDIFAGRIKVDFERGLAFVNGAVTGMDLVQISDHCNELSADFKPEDAEPDPRVDRTGERDDDQGLVKEKEILTVILERAASALYDGHFADFSMLEQGSGACFWRKGFPRTCTAFQAGTSDHDVEVYIPSDPQNPGRDTVQEAQDLLDKLLDDLRKDPDSGLDKIGSVTLFSVSKESFEDAELLNGTPQNRSGDPAGDLAMGRQLLLVLWILEGEYVTFPGLVEGLPLDKILSKLQSFPPGDRNPILRGEPSGIPRLEGYEWSLLQELNFYKTGAMLRVAGACENHGSVLTVPRSDTGDYESNDRGLNFEAADFLRAECDDQLHTVAKSAIRSVMARLAADARTNPSILEIDREHYRSDACLTGVHDVRHPPAMAAGYTEKPCGGFEEYIASVAIKSVRDGLGVFEPSDLPRIFNFYCAKVGQHCANRDGDLIGGPLFTTDEEANTFIADALGFIEDTQNETVEIYADTIAGDTKPIGPIPFLTAIANVCAHHGVQGIDASSPRKSLRDCNRAIVGHKLDGQPDEVITPPPTYDTGPPLPVEVQPNPDRRGFVLRHFGVRNTVERNLRVRVLNRGRRTLDAVTMRMYEKDDENQPKYVVPQFFKDFEVKNFKGGERRVLDVNGESNPKGAPYFPTLFSLDRFTPNVPGAIALFLDPDRRVPEYDKKDNQAGFFFYLLDRMNPQGPPNLPREPKPAIDDTSPDPLCSRHGTIDLEMMARLTEDPLASGVRDLTVQVGQEIRLDYRVINRGADALKDLEVRRSMLDQPAFTKSTVPPESTQPDGVQGHETFRPPGVGTFFISATASAKDDKGNTIKSDSARVRITVVRPPCDTFIATVKPDPNPTDDNGLPSSEIRKGGSLYRYYRVFDGTTGQPKANAQISAIYYELPGGDIVHLPPILTDAEGYLVHPSADPQKDNPRGLRLEADTLGPPSHNFKVQLRPEGEIGDRCGQSFDVRIKDPEFTRNLAAGASLNIFVNKVLFKVLGLGVNLGNGLELEQKGGTSVHEDLNVSRKINTALRVGAHQESKKFLIPFQGNTSLAKIEGDAGLNLLTAGEDVTKFPTPLSTDSCVKIVELVNGEMMATAGTFGSPIISIALLQLGDYLTGLDQLRTSFGASMGVSLDARVRFPLPVLKFNGTGIGALDSKGITGSFEAGASATVLGGVSYAPHPSSELTLRANVNIQGSLAGGLTTGLAETRDGLVQQNDSIDIVKLTSVVEKIAGQLAGSLGARLSYALVYDGASDGFPLKQISVSIGAETEWGITSAVLENVEDTGAAGSSESFKFTISNPDHLEEALEETLLIALKLQTPIASVLIGADPVGNDIVKLIALSDGYQITQEKGNGGEFKLALKDLIGSKQVGDFSVKFRYNRSIAHELESGVVKRGGPDKLATYREDDPNLPPSTDNALIDTLTDCLGRAKPVLAAAYKLVQTLINLGTGVPSTPMKLVFPLPMMAPPVSMVASRAEVTPAGVELLVDGAAEPDDGQPLEFELVAFQYRPQPAPSGDFIMSPASVTGPAGRPHYGFGGFFQFGPEGRALAAPAALTIHYLDSEVAGLDESRLAIYAWSQARGDWDLMGGVVDAASHSVSASVNKLGMFTLGLPMPAGTIALTQQSTTTPDPDHPKTTVVSTSAPVAMNTGGLVPDGTLFTVRSLQPGTDAFAPFGSVTSADEDASTDGVQVRSQNGVIQFTVEYPGLAGTASLLVTSVEGTAIADKTVVFP